MTYKTAISLLTNEEKSIYEEVPELAKKKILKFIYLYNRLPVEKRFSYKIIYGNGGKWYKELFFIVKMTDFDKQNNNLRHRPYDQIITFINEQMREK